MKERMKANASTGFFKALAVITLLLGAAAGILGNVSSKPEGTFLVPSFLESLRNYYLFNIKHLHQHLFLLLILFIRYIIYFFHKFKRILHRNIPP